LEKGGIGGGGAIGFRNGGTTDGKFLKPYRAGVSGGETKGGDGEGVYSSPIQ